MKDAHGLGITPSKYFTHTPKQDAKASLNPSSFSPYLANVSWIVVIMLVLETSLISRPGTQLSIKAVIADLRMCESFVVFKGACSSITSGTSLVWIS